MRGNSKCIGKALGWVRMRKMEWNSCADYFGPGPFDFPLSLRSPFLGLLCTASLSSVIVESAMQLIYSFKSKASKHDKVQLESVIDLSNPTHNTRLYC